MFKSLIMTLVFLSIFSIKPSFASFDGLDLQKLTDTPVSGYSRPCCNFAVSFFTDLFGISKLTSLDRLGSHQFFAGKWKHEKRTEENGITFTCKAGFVDTAHLRDNADWTMQLMWILPQVLGTGEKLTVRQEGGGTKTLFFPVVDRDEISKLKSEDIAEIARRISYEIAVWHEIATGLEVHVSTKFAKETSSSFSIEDNYSNLLGTFIGVEAVSSELPYEKAMTGLIEKTLEDMEVQDYETVQRAYLSVRDVWWEKKLFPNKFVSLKKNMDTFGVVRPARIPNIENYGCNKQVELVSLNVPKSSDLYKLTITPDKESAPKINKMLHREASQVEVSDFPKLIDGIEIRFSKYLSKFSVNSI